MRYSVNALKSKLYSDSKYFTKNKSFQLTQRSMNMSFVFYFSRDMFDLLLPSSKGNKATHFLLRLTPSLTPVGTIRCAKLAPFTYKLTRLAVLKNYRKQNFGRFLVLALHNWVKQQAGME